MLWYGSVGSIPTGYALCDGNNGTPDLRAKFIVAAGSTYNPGDVGGNVSHTHTFTANSHFHLLTAGYVIKSGINFASNTTSVAATGTTNSGNNLPPFHALCYIMRI